MSTPKRHFKDDHPKGAPHQECKVDHHGVNVPRHCRCGAKWPCNLGTPAGKS